MGLLDNIKENVPHLKKMAQTLLTLNPPRATGPKVSEIQGMIDIFADAENGPKMRDIRNSVANGKTAQDIRFEEFTATGDGKSNDIEIGFGSTMPKSKWEKAKKTGFFKGIPVEKGANGKFFMRGGDALKLLAKDINEHELKANSIIGSKDFIALAPEMRAAATRLAFSGTLKNSDPRKEFKNLKKAIIASNKTPNTSAEIQLMRKGKLITTTIGEALIDETKTVSGKPDNDSKALDKITRPFVRRTFGAAGSVANLFN